MPVGDEDEGPAVDATTATVAVAVDPTGTTLAGVVVTGVLLVVVGAGRRVLRTLRRGGR